MKPPSKPLTHKEIATMFAIFSIHNFHERMSQAKGTGELIDTLNEIKKEAKEKFKQLAMEKHPDRHPECEEEFKKISAAYDSIKNLKIFQRPPPQHVPMRVINIQHMNFNGFWSGSSTTTTITNEFCNFGPTITVKWTKAS